jgi:hypothetical protein
MKNEMNEKLSKIEEIRNRVNEMKLLNTGDSAAHLERMSIEEALNESPYKAHLYIERDFQHLIFLELQEQTVILQKMFKLLTDQHQGTAIAGSYASAMDVSFAHNEPPVETPGECVEVDPGMSPLANETVVMHGDSGESPKTTPRKTTTRKKR